MPKLEYSPVALEKIGAIYRYITEDLHNQSGAINTVLSIREKIDNLKTMPELGISLSSLCDKLPDHYYDARVLFCGKYIAFYKYDGETVKILQIYHTKEDYINHLLDM